MRATCRSAAIAASIAATVAPALALALPPPPYQADADPGAAPARQTLDRYGGGRTHPAVAPAQGFGAQAFNATAANVQPHYLSWSGKAAAQPGAPIAPADGWRPYRPTQIAQPPAPSLYDKAPPRPMRQMASEAAAQPVAPPPQMAAAQPYAGGARFYSLHRDYGIAPDAIPIPPAFFGPTADLSAPPADPVLKRVTGSDGATHTQAVPADDPGGQ
jgi:hypothetical protein